MRRVSSDQRLVVDYLRRSFVSADKGRRLRLVFDVLVVGDGGRDLDSKTTSICAAKGSFGLGTGRGCLEALVPRNNGRKLTVASDDARLSVAAICVDPTAG